MVPFLIICGIVILVIIILSLLLAKANKKVKKANKTIELNKEENQKKEAEKNATRIVKCKECGANNTLKNGEIKECEYCGTILGK